MKRKVIYDHTLLKQADQKVNPNVRQLCDRIGISRTHYYNVINGRKGSLGMIVAICHELGVSPAQIVSLDTPQKNLS